MQPGFEFFPSNEPVVPVMTPLSFSSLPEKLDFPPKRRFDEVALLRRQVIENSGLRPGTYSAIEPDVRRQVESVLDSLTVLLTEELSTANALDLCARLYRRHEEALGHMLRSNYDSIPTFLSGHNVQQTIERQEMAWFRISPFTESMRWLIEMSVKFSQASAGETIGGRKFDWLIILAYEIHQWDTIWENILHDVIPHQVTVNGDFTLTLGLTPRARAIQKAHMNACMPGRVKGNREWAVEAIRRNDTIITAERGAAIVERTATLPEYKILSRALEAERGYSVRDWLKFACGLLDSFDATGYFKVINLAKLDSFLSSKWNLSSDRLENLLVDHGLSGKTVSSTPVDRLRPMRNARRDSRLLRRPTVVLEKHGNRICLYGVDTVELGAKMFQERLVSGRLQLPDMTPYGRLNRAIGKVQKNLGDEFSDRISQRCTEALIENFKEKRTAGKEMIPEGRGFGPVDVFIVDGKHKRFILVEVKDVSTDGTVPRAMKAERQKFAKFLKKLKRQVDWFSVRSNALKAEYGISLDENYAVEGVIVVNQPRVWMYANSEELPILDAEAFFRALKGGGKFSTIPVP